MKLIDCGKILQRFACLYQNFSLTPEAIKVWHEMFHSEDPKNFYMAMHAAIKKPNQQFFPSPGQVQSELEFIKNTSIRSAKDVWDKIIKLASQGVREIYLQEKLKDEHPCVLKILRFLDYERIRTCSMETELPWIRKEFCKLYDEEIINYSKRDVIAISQETTEKILGQIPNLQIKVIK